MTDAELQATGMWAVPIRPLRTSVGELDRLWVTANERPPSRPSYDPADFEPAAQAGNFEPRLCLQCERVFRNRWVFLRHRPEGRAAITEPADPTVPCYSDRHLRRLGMRTITARNLDGSITREVWCDDASLSPLDEAPGIERERGKGRAFTEGNGHGIRQQGPGT